MGGAGDAAGMLAEMETGEGKTITATLAGGTASRSPAWPVHVVTVNDYLAERDAEQWARSIEALGLQRRAGRARQEPDERRAAYACDITYCTNKELVFDYLRDRIVLAPASRSLRLQARAAAGRRPGAPARLLLRGLHVAIVDEADSVLIDEARTPLIIWRQGSPESSTSQRCADEALDMARQAWVPARITRICLRRSARVDLTDAGLDRIGAVGQPARRAVGGAACAREELARTGAVRAASVPARHRNTSSRDGKVQIVDEFTGRVMPDRSWEQGLHQMIEAKEGCEVTGRKVTLARITYQRFFRRYRHLAGMTGTAARGRGRICGVYRLPRHRACRPTARCSGAHRPGLILPTARTNWRRDRRARGSAARSRPAGADRHPLGRDIRGAWPGC